jgi:serralysin
VEGATGSNGDDLLIGNAARNFLAGGRGDDRIYGRGGNGELDGSLWVLDEPAGTDLLGGGAGHDRCLFGTTVVNCGA